MRLAAFGYSEAIFGTSHLVGVSYAPRFKNLKRQRLYIFRSRQHLDRSEWKIKPTGYCDEESIIQFWDDILRFIATIKLKETTASDIFRRLNSYSKQHGLYHALKAFGQILKSIFILRVIDEPVLRMSLEKVLSGIEHVHAFHARGLGRQSTRIPTGGKRRPGDGRSLQTAHQELHHLLELPVSVAETRRDR